ncbi:hypothetical protein GIB67_036134 [Kingdonia uniflora]|uniref:FAD-binding domain-containing protein n=1 Tax=Kingdonia uniflora TaxID=39325 RepID=A0A7J7N9H4_9MAGN|nr:hypothetical protein GIB67_036134 [Kingdonia uniflora]
MVMEMKEDVVIIGAGIAGLATALGLKRVGIRALVLEKSPELRTTGAALTLFPNAWLALDALGLTKKLDSLYAPYKGGYITDVSNGAVQEIHYPQIDGVISGPRTMQRRNLLAALAEELPADTIRFSTKIRNSIETRTIDGTTIIILHLDDGTMIKTKILIGCDGVHSRVAHWLGLSAPISSGRWAVGGLARYPQGHGFDHKFQQFLHEGRRAGITPINDTELQWFLVSNSRHNTGDEMNAYDPKLVQNNVLESLTDIPKVYDVVLGTDASSLTCSSLVFRVPWNVLFGKLSDGNITVVGDSMHPMTPEIAQGACSALEDAVVLARHIGNSFHEHGKIIPGEVSKAIELYVKERRWRVTALITGSFLSGWVQQIRSGWLTNFFRDKIFYKFLYGRIADFVSYDCGKLPHNPCPIDEKFD